MSYGNYLGGFSALPMLTPAEQEKKALKRAGNAIGLTFVLMEVGINFLILVCSICLQLSPAAWVLTDPLCDWVVQVIFTTLCFTFPFAICARMQRFRLGDLLPLRPVRKELLLPFIMLGLGCFAVGNYATDALYQIFSMIGLVPNIQTLVDLTGVGGFFIEMIAIAILPALCEEFALRGVVLGTTRRFGDGFAIFLSAAIFGLMHGNLVQIPFAFIGGLVLGYVVVATGSMWPAILIHLANNFMSFLADWVIQMASTLSNVIMFFYYLIFCVLGLIGFVLLLKRCPESFHLPPSQTVLRFSKKLSAFVATPGMILFIIMMGLKVLMVQFA